jgi:hypothetical protein
VEQISDERGNHGDDPVYRLPPDQCDDETPLIDIDMEEPNETRIPATRA